MPTISYSTAVSLSVLKHRERRALKLTAPKHLTYKKLKEIIAPYRFTYESGETMEDVIKKVVLAIDLLAEGTYFSLASLIENKSKKYSIHLGRVLANLSESDDARFERVTNGMSVVYKRNGKRPHFMNNFEITYKTDYAQILL